MHPNYTNEVKNNPKLDCSIFHPKMIKMNFLFIFQTFFGSINVFELPSFFMKKGNDHTHWFDYNVEK